MLILGDFEYLVWFELSFQFISIGTIYMVLECIQLKQNAIPKPIVKIIQVVKT